MKHLRKVKSFQFPLESGGAGFVSDEYKFEAMPLQATHPLSKNVATPLITTVGPRQALNTCKWRRVRDWSTELSDAAINETDANRLSSEFHIHTSTLSVDR